MVCSCCNKKKRLFDMFYSVEGGKVSLWRMLGCCGKIGIGYDRWRERTVRYSFVPAQKKGQESLRGIPDMAAYAFSLC